jgi:FMN-dependent NADH-azoreductase
MKLLHIDTSILGANSASRQVSATVVERLKAVTPSLEVTYRDLAAEPLAHLSGPRIWRPRRGRCRNRPSCKKTSPPARPCSTSFSPRTSS